MKLDPDKCPVCNAKIILNSNYMLYTYRCVRDQNHYLQGQEGFYMDIDQYWVNYDNISNKTLVRIFNTARDDSIEIPNIDFENFNKEQFIKYLDALFFYR